MRAKNIILLTAASLVAIIGGSIAGLSLARQVAADIGSRASPTMIASSSLDAQTERERGRERDDSLSGTFDRPPPVARANLNQNYTPGRVRNGVRILSPYEPARKKERDRLTAEVNWEDDYYGPGADYEFVDAATADSDDHRFLTREKDLDHRPQSAAPVSTSDDNMAVKVTSVSAVELDQAIPTSAAPPQP